jgi:hypothetical protein
VFLTAIPLAAIVFGLGWLLEELPLRDSTTLNASKPADGQAVAGALVPE